MHGGLPYDPIHCQGQGHESLKVRIPSIFKIIVSSGCWTPTRWRHSSTPLCIHGSITAKLFLLVHQGQSRTSYSVCWTRLRTSSAAPGSLTAVCFRYGMTSFLAWLPWSGVLQVGSDSFPASEWPRSTVPVGLLCPGRRCWHWWLLGLFSCQPHNLELSPGYYPGPDCLYRLFKTYLFAWY